MKNLYYMVWADALHQTKKKNPKIDEFDLIWNNLPYISFIDSGYVFLVILWVGFFNEKSYYPELGFILPGSFIDGVLSFTLVVYLPVLLVDYLLIIKSKFYKKIMNKYPSYNGNVVMGHVFVMLVFLIISVIVIRLLK